MYSVIIICYDNVIKVNWSFVFCFRYRSAKKMAQSQKLLCKGAEVAKTRKVGKWGRKTKKVHLLREVDVPSSVYGEQRDKEQSG